MKKILLLLIYFLLTLGLFGCYDEKGATLIIQNSFSNPILQFHEGDTKDTIRNNLILLEVDGDVTIEWTSNKEDIISNEGIVNRPKDMDSMVFFSANATYKKTTLRKTYELIVKADFSDFKSVSIDIEGNIHFEQTYLFNGVIKVEDDKLDILINLYLGGVHAGIIYYFEREEFYASGQIITLFPTLPTELVKIPITDTYQRISTSIINLIRLQNIEGVVDQKSLLDIINDSTLIFATAEIKNDVLDVSFTIDKSLFELLNIFESLPNIDISNYSKIDLALAFSIDIDLLLTKGTISAEVIEQQTNVNYSLSVALKFNNYNNTKTRNIA